MTDRWTLTVGDVALGSLTNPTEDGMWTVCDFTATSAFDRYARAFSTEELWVDDDHSLDAIIDEIAVEGIWLTNPDGFQLIDPDIHITDATAHFKTR